MAAATDPAGNVYVLGALRVAKLTGEGTTDGAYLSQFGTLFIPPSLEAGGGESEAGTIIPSPSQDEG